MAARRVSLSDVNTARSAGSAPEIYRHILVALPTRREKVFDDVPGRWSILTATADANHELVTRR